MPATRRGLVTALLGVAATATIGVAVVQFLRMRPETGMPRLLAPASRLVLPGGGVQVRIAQRSTVALPGSHGRVLLTIDDITRGQVMVSVATDGGVSVIARRSVRANGSIPFTLDGEAYTLTLTQLRNNLIGSDWAVFTVAAAASGTFGTATDRGRSSR